MKYTAEWLKDHGYDGLFCQISEGETCGCGPDDFMPCEEPGDCVPAYKRRDMFYPAKEHHEKL